MFDRLIHVSAWRTAAMHATLDSMWTWRWFALGAVCTVSIAAATHAKPVWSVRDVVEALHRASPSAPVDLSNAKLRFMDLARLDFKRARLKRVDFHGADLTGANFSHCNLRHAHLDRATIVGADFLNADLRDALIRLPHSAGSPGFDAQATPRFVSANLSGARLVGRFDGGQFAQANLQNADLGPYGDWTQNTLTRRTVIISGDFTGAQLQGANLAEAILTFSNFRNAQLAGVNLVNADLVGADFTGADLSGARISGADFEGANLKSAIGLARVVGQAEAVNWPFGGG